MPRFIGVRTFLVIENHSPTDISARFINSEADSWEVIHFPFPGSGERRLRVNWHGRLHEKEYYKARQYCDDRHLVGFHLLPSIIRQSSPEDLSTRLAKLLSVGHNDSQRRLRAWRSRHRHTPEEALIRIRSVAAIFYLDRIQTT